MPRIRTIKPSFFQSDDVSALPLRARLTWIGLWTQCDDQGRMKDHTRLIKAAIWPLDPVSLAEVEQDLSTLADHGRIVRYEVDGQRYLAVVNWEVHQSINRPTPSRIPGPAVNGHVRLTEPTPTAHAGKGKEGNGREGTRARTRDDPSAPDPPDSEPPTRCDQHLKSRNPPKCGPCADARKAHGRWISARTARLAAAPKCPIHQGQPADNCGGCRADELAPA